MFDRRWIPFCGLLLVLPVCALCALLLVINPPGITQDTRQSPGEQLSNAHLIEILGRHFDSVQLAQGREIYVQNCAACHGIDGQGQFPEAPLEPDSTGRIGAPPHNESGHSWHHSDILLIRYVTEGGFSDLTRFYAMPPFGDILSGEQIRLVIAYIKTLWTDEQRDMQRQLTEEEEKLFSEQG